MPSKTGLAIGISYQGTKISPLGGTVGDSLNIAKFMAKFGYAMTLVNDQQFTRTSAQYPSKSNIIYWINKMLRDAKDGDELFIGYAGHGTQMAFNPVNTEEVDGRDESIIPADYSFTDSSALTDDEIQRLLSNGLITKPNCKVFMLFDCCHSGTAADLRYTYNYSGPTSDFVFVDAKVDNAFKAKTILLSGCKDEEVSWETMINLTGGAKSRQGVMTSSFINVVSKNPAALQNVFQIVREMFVYTKPYKQQPQVSCNFDIAKESNAQLRAVINYDVPAPAVSAAPAQANPTPPQANPSNPTPANPAAPSKTKTKPSTSILSSIPVPGPAKNKPKNSYRTNYGNAANTSNNKVNYEAFQPSTVSIKNTSKIPNKADLLGMIL